MKLFVLRIWESLRQWTLKWAHSRHMAAALFFIAFIESSFFPIPPDILLIAILLINAKRWWFYAGLTTISSVFGAFFGYLIGWAFYQSIGHRIVDFYNLGNVMEILRLRFSENTFFTVFVAAFTPIPFKIITITAGVFKAPILIMAIAAILGRGMRYFGIAYVIKLFGKKINHLVFKYFNIVSIIFVAALIIIFIFIKILF
jgi:membrane protein YqaA with SNARE-associated domain